MSLDHVTATPAADAGSLCRLMLARRATTTLAVLALAGLLGACGSDDGSGGGGDVASLSGDDSDEQAQGDETDAEAEILDWVECIRDEGVDIPDPTRDADGNLVISGDGFQIGGSEDPAPGRGGGPDPSNNDDEASGDEDDDQAYDEVATPDSDEMDAATEVCGDFPALGADDISEEDRQAEEDAALEFAECMRDEGIEDFPDPDFSDEGPGGTPDTVPGEQSQDENDDGPFGEGGPFGEVDLDDPEVSAAFEACQDVLADLVGGPGEDGDSGESPSTGGSDS
jgi:hypothetical protein